jgi:hypothetical protein
MITHVAIKFQGVVYSLPAPKRHHDVIFKIWEETGLEYGTNRNPDQDEDQGFLDETGRFYNRKQALAHAQACEQEIKGKILLNMLFSENLW